ALLSVQLHLLAFRPEEAVKVHEVAAGIKRVRQGRMVPGFRSWHERPVAMCADVSRAFDRQPPWIHDGRVAVALHGQAARRVLILPDVFRAGSMTGFASD